MSCFAFSVYANEGVDDESGIVEALRAAESVKVQFELSSVDFENLTTSDHIIAYEYTNTGCVYNSEFIPIKYQNELVGWVIKTQGREWRVAARRRGDSRINELLGLHTRLLQLL